MPGKQRALVVVSDQEFQSKVIGGLVRRGFAADAVDSTSAAAALLGINSYAAVVLEVSPNDAACPQLLGDLAFRAEQPRLVLLASDSPADFRRRLDAFRPQIVLPSNFDDATLSSVIHGCLAGGGAAGSAVSANVREDDEAAAGSNGNAAGSRSDVDAPSGSGNVIAVRLAEPQRAQVLSQHLHDEGFVVRVAQSTDEVYTLLNHDRIDLLIIEEDLPGFLSGLDVVEKLQRELLRPDVLLLSHARLGQSERIAALGLARIVPPSATAAEITEATLSVLRQRTTLSCCVPHSARQLVAKHTDLRPLPQLLTKLTSYLSMADESLSIRRLAQDIQSDPRATAELLRFTNGASNGLRRRVNNVAEAVTLLGPRRAIVLILSQATASTCTDLVAAWEKPMRTWYYRRSVLTAGTAEAFARIEGVSPDTAFLLGLMQDIGIAVTANAIGERYARAVERVQQVPQLTLHHFEKTEFGHTHADVSAALLQKWEMPASLIEPVHAHHGANFTLSKTGQSFVRVMEIGEAIADLSDCQCPQRRNALNALLARFRPDQRARCSEALAEGVARAVEATAILRLPIPAPQSMGAIVAHYNAGERSALAVTA